MQTADTRRVERSWQSGVYAIRDDNTFGLANGEFTVNGVDVDGITKPFDEGKVFRGKSDEKGKFMYLPSQNASLTLATKIKVNLIFLVPSVAKENIDWDEILVHAGKEKAKEMGFNPIPVYADEKGELIVVSDTLFSIRNGSWALNDGNSLVPFFMGRFEQSGRNDGKATSGTSFTS